MSLNSLVVVVMGLLAWPAHAVDVDKALEAAAKPKAVANESVVDGSAQSAQREAEGKVSEILDERARKRREFWSAGAGGSSSDTGSAATPQASRGTAGTGVAYIKEWGRMETVPDKPTGYEVTCRQGKNETIWRRPGGDWFHKSFPNGRFVARGSASLDEAARQLCQ